MIGVASLTAAPSDAAERISGAVFDEQGRVDPLAIPALPNDIFPRVGDVSTSAKGVPITATFVDSQGRSLMYRYVLPDAATPASPQPVMIYFHGNNVATQQEILDGFFPGVAFFAGQRGVAAVVVASPGTRPAPQAGVRQWYREDERTIHEFLTQRLPSHFAVDNQRLYFMGGSQGTCFLNDFMHSFGPSYRGGFFGGCGCFNTLDATWTPPAEFVAGMKVYIASTRGDFLLEPSWNGYGLYKYTIGFDTRGDLEADGGHCAAHWTQLMTALDWFTGQTQIPAEPFRPHWSRVSARMVSGLALTADGRVWKTLYDAAQNSTSLRRSSDRGLTWPSVQTFAGRFESLTATGQTLFAIDPAGALRKSNDSGQSFEVAAPSQYAHVLADGAGSLYLQNVNGSILAGGADGSMQRLLDPGPKTLLNFDVTAGLVPSAIITADNASNPTALFVGPRADDRLTQTANTPAGPAFSAAWDGNRLYALANPVNQFDFKAFRSLDVGLTWTEIVLPTAFANYSYFGASVSALSDRAIITHGGFGSSWLSSDDGVNWTRLPGLSTASFGRLAANGNSVYFTDDAGVFRLDMTDPNQVFKDGFESVQSAGN